MSLRWERSIEEWYNKSHTAGLEYLDLASSEKVTNHQLAHNLSVLYDRVSLFGRIQIKNQKEISENLNTFSEQIKGLERSVKQITQTLTLNQPLTSSEVRKLVQEISAQPKEIEAQAVSLLQKLEQKIAQVEKIAENLSAWTGVNE